MLEISSVSSKLNSGVFQKKNSPIVKNNVEPAKKTIVAQGRGIIIIP